MTVCLLVMKNIEIEVKLIFGHITAESIFQYCLNLLYWMVNITIQYQQNNKSVALPKAYTYTVSKSNGLSMCSCFYVFVFKSTNSVSRLVYILTS